MRLKFRPKMLSGLLLIVLIGLVAQAGLAQSSSSNNTNTHEGQGVSIVKSCS